jgi:pSer/pThr/pTyr-binding forkhead associated (FHA) protein
VIDLHSLNGVYVNGEVVLQAPLADGDLLRVGGFTFLVELAPAAAEAPAANPRGNPVLSIVQTLAQRPQRRAS